MTNQNHWDTTECKIGSVHGRFQPFHKGHLTYVFLAFLRCKHLIIGITNPDYRHMIPNEADTERHLTKSNPFTFYERYLMITYSLEAAGVGRTRFDIVPFPIDDPNLLANYCPKVPVYLRDRGAWTRKKLDLLESHGWPVELILDGKDLDISGTETRRRIEDGGDWKILVPDGTSAVISSINMSERMSQVNSHQ